MGPGRAKKVQLLGHISSLLFKSSAEKLRVPIACIPQEISKDKILSPILTWEVTQHYLCCILLVLNPGKCKGREHSFDF